MFDLTGKTALVTGASGGIGKDIARGLIAAGASVALSGTRREALEALAAEIGGTTHVLPCNLADRDDADRLIPAA
jgi:3-oxoacyl-[acyl-carrier protein] reductase